LLCRAVAFGYLTDFDGLFWREGAVDGFAVGLLIGADFKVVAFGGFEIFRGVLGSLARPYLFKLARLTVLHIDDVAGGVFVFLDIHRDRFGFFIGGQGEV